MVSTGHHPPHIYLDDTWYVITSSVYGGRPLLQTGSHKALVRDQLNALVVEFKLALAAWAILDNHSHILIKSRTGPELNRFIGRWHGQTSFDLNKLDNTRERQIWHSFWDTCIRTEADYWTRFNYIHYNPIKHGYVSRLENWRWSSYRYYLELKGEEWLSDALERYPVIDFTDPNDGLDKASKAG
jgi:putative transposase